MPESVPILFIVFNRPEVTIRVLEAIRATRPSRLYVACDGPRDHYHGDLEKVGKVRQIIGQIDWPCQVFTLFRDHNLGCALAVTKAIDWFFSKEERGIILEDDCLPHPDFYPFCQDLLARYAVNETVMHIGGSNFQHGRKQGAFSYYASKYLHPWGWATWRRAWNHYRYHLPFNAIRESHLIECNCPSSQEKTFWHRKLRKLESEPDGYVWDYQWMFCCWENKGIALIPSQNLITNIGFGDGATGTQRTSRVANLESFPLGLRKHPEQLSLDAQADRFTFFNSGYFFHPTLMDKARWSIKALLPKALRSIVRKFKHGLSPEPVLH